MCHPTGTLSQTLPPSDPKLESRRHAATCQHAFHVAAVCPGGQGLSSSLLLASLPFCLCLIPLLILLQDSRVSCFGQPRTTTCVS